MKLDAYYLNNQGEWIKLKKNFNTREETIEYLKRKDYRGYKLVNPENIERKVEVLSDDE